MGLETPLRHGIHSETIEIAGRSYHVRRDFETIRRIEEAVGPIGDVLRDIERLRITHALLADCYMAALVGCQPAPAREEVERHILSAGYARALQPIGRLLVNLFVGDERLEAALREGEAAGAINPPGTA